MVAPGCGPLICHHQDVRDNVEQFCLWVDQNVVEEAKEISVKTGLNGLFSKQKEEAGDWSTSAELKKTSQDFMMEAGHWLHSSWADWKC